MKATSWKHCFFCIFQVLVSPRTIPAVLNVRKQSVWMNCLTFSYFTCEEHHNLFSGLWISLFETLPATPISWKWQPLCAGFLLVCHKQNCTAIPQVSYRTGGVNSPLDLPRLHPRFTIARLLNHLDVSVNASPPLLTPQIAWLENYESCKLAHATPLTIALSNTK